MPGFIILITLLLLTGTVPATADEISPERKAELRYLLKQDCGACHGMRLKGGLGPSLGADRLAPYDIQFITQTILQGRPGTPMPPWKPFMSEQEALWLARQLKQGAH